MPETGKVQMRGMTSKEEKWPTHPQMRCVQASRLRSKVCKKCQRQGHENGTRAGRAAVGSEPSSEAIPVLPGKIPYSFLCLLTLFYLSTYFPTSLLDMRSLR